MAKHFGIDFGTTNSAVVVYDDQRRLFTKIGEKGPIPFPSVIAVDNLTQEVSAGQGVKDQIITLREGGMHLVIESVKTILDSDQLWTTPAKTWHASDIASELFRALAQRAEEDKHPPLHEAVVAIPIGMNADKRATLRNAAHSAGVRVLSFISEPTAAFIAHSGQLRHCRFAVVFDWGGGTLDISVLEVRGGCIIERYTAGSPKAGDYIDNLLARWLHSKISETHGLTIGFDNVAPEERHILLNESEKAKRYLQQEDAIQTVIELGRYAGLTLVAQTLTKTTLNSILEDVVSGALNLLLHSVEAARVSQEEIGKLIIVGGTSQLKLLQRQLRERWPHPNIIFPREADWDIARGAAWVAAHPGCYRMAESIGVVLSDDQFHAIFPVNTKQESARSTLHFGLVEDATTATFNFAARNGDERAMHIGELHTPCFGFRDELIELDCHITADLVFEANGDSEAKPQRKQSFKYDMLRWMYELPESDISQENP